MSDASPLLYLADVGHLELLPKLYGEVVIPEEVHAELGRGVPREAALDHIGKWLRVAHVANRARVIELSDEVDLGEAAALALAEEVHAELVLIDETHGRDLAQRLGFRITGVGGILAEAKMCGLITSVKPELDRLLTETNYRCTTRVYENILRRAGEKP